MKKLIPFIFSIILFSSQICLADHIVGFLIPISGLGDQSFNDMTYAGLVQAKNAHSFTLIREQSAGSDTESRRVALKKLINQGATIIVTNGWEFKEIILEFAQSHQDLQFIINDIPIAGLPNVLSIVFGQHEGSFLAGALAAWMTKTGKIGFIGGKDMPVIRAFQTGYREGALYGRADIEIAELFLSQKEDMSSGFDNPGLAFDVANTLYSQDIDIIFSVAGLAGNGIIRAAAKNGKFAIGVDADQDHMAKGNVLTSVMKRLDRATFEALSGVLKGNFTSGIHVLGLKEDGVALSPMTYTRHLIPPEILQKIEELRLKIISGEITVSNYLSPVNEKVSRDSL